MTRTLLPAAFLALAAALVLAVAAAHASTDCAGAVGELAAGTGVAAERLADGDPRGALEGLAAAARH